VNESDAYKMIQTLGNYLKTEIETSYGTIEKQLRYGKGTVLGEGHSVKVTVSNTAPVVTTWPLVVFMGVGIGFTFNFTG